MFLGKIFFEIENKNNRWYFCRAIGNNLGHNFKKTIGICNVVRVENCDLLEEYGIGDIVETYAIFHKKIDLETFNRSYCDIKISPITEKIYNELIDIYPQQTHAFKVREK